MRRVTWIVGGCLVGVGTLAETGWGFHTYQEDLGTLLGPTAWGMYLILPIPYLVLGLIAYRIYRAYRHQETGASQATDHPEDRRKERRSDDDDRR